MAIDTTIQFNGRNSYKVTSQLWQVPFYVTDMDYITHSFQGMCDVAQASGVKAKTKFLAADGSLISEVSHSFALGVLFELKTITVTVPAGAAMAMLGFLQGSRSWWVAEPKSEQGQTATPFNVNYQGQLTWMTPTGVYTGLLRASQIMVTGSPAQPGEDLSSRLVTINQNVVNLTASVGGHASRLTNIEAGQITLSDRLDTTEPRTSRLTAAGLYTGSIVASQITSGTIDADRIAAKTITGAKLADGTVTNIKIASGLSADKITAGTISADRIAAKAITGAKLADGTVTGTQIAASTITGAKIAANTITADKINVTDLFSKNITASGSITGAKLYGSKISAGAASGFSMAVGSSKVQIDGSTYYYDALALYQYSGDTTPCFSIAGINRDVYMQRKDGDNFLFTNNNGIFIRNSGVRSDLSLHNSGPNISYGSGSNFKGEIGVDEGGAYWTMGAANSGQKTYFKNM